MYQVYKSSYRLMLAILAAEDMSVEAIALGFLDVANEAMCRPIRQVWIHILFSTIRN